MLSVPLRNEHQNFPSKQDKRLILARMRVPNLAKNGFYSLLLGI
jgi:hypothetical protein